MPPTILSTGTKQTNTPALMKLSSSGGDNT